MLSSSPGIRALHILKNGHSIRKHNRLRSIHTTSIIIV
jgi:hypothetical protein